MAIMKKNILIIGGNSKLGRRYIESNKSDYNLHVTYFETTQPASANELQYSLDLSSGMSIKAFMTKIEGIPFDAVWVRPVSDVVNTIIGCGLRLSSFTERPGQEFQQHNQQYQADDRLWYNNPGLGFQHPSTYSIVAFKESGVQSSEQET